MEATTKNIDYMIQILYHELSLSITTIMLDIDVPYDTVARIVKKKRPACTLEHIDMIKDEYLDGYKPSRKYSHILCKEDGTMLQLRSLRGGPVKYYKTAISEGAASIVVGGKTKKIKADRIIYEAFNEHDPRIVSFDYADEDHTNCALSNLIPIYYRKNKGTKDKRYEIARQIDTLSPEEAHTLYDEELSYNIVERMLLKEIDHKHKVTPEIKEEIRHMHLVQGRNLKEIKHCLQKYLKTDVERTYRDIRKERYVP